MILPRWCRLYRCLQWQRMGRKSSKIGRAELLDGGMKTVLRVRRLSSRSQLTGNQKGREVRYLVVLSGPIKIKIDPVILGTRGNTHHTLLSRPLRWSLELQEGRTTTYLRVILSIEVVPACRMIVFNSRRSISRTASTPGWPNAANPHA